MKLKRLSIIILTIIFLSFSFAPVIAVDASPSSGTYAPGASFDISLVAAPQAGELVVTVRLLVTNMTVANYTPPASGWDSITADCGGGTYFTSTTVCVTLGRSTDIPSGASLGTITVTAGGVGSATLERTSGNSYSTGGADREVLGTAGTYTISDSGTTTTPTPTPSVSTLPATGIMDNGDGIYMIIGGNLLIASGFITLIYMGYTAKERSRNYFFKK